ncbi:TPA: methyltransferase domain-containing protein [Enterococcus faecalis]|uniref:methyltransferase domain-containing protein n=3 Tax=Bacillota TaxID=1239 RepID=UPI0018781F93|nr:MULTISPECIES: methyltransferase domain-containing protein [Lactobacillales]EME7179744.1 methyltransferase domain-containing protein [Enterococcus faecium]EME7180229.1 methyltransferase domain-containing protein [Enterococcus faecium]MCD5103400.1 methyltransferase domain-containing protein [Enterococcus faecalis]MDT2623623.1 methyltransferase domain-containing protein [Enterococcus hirae]HDP1317621.1 methyltransferase domain-containing protein [Enterococcus faecalis]
MGNLGAQKEKRNDTPISAKKDIMGDKTVRVRADLHHIIKIETAKNGGNVKEVMENGASSVVGVDISHKMLEVAKGKTHFPQIEYECCAIEDVDFPEESFDVILSSLAFHYVADYENLIKKIYRMLKAGGNLVFTVEHPVFTAHGTQDWYYNEKGEILHFPVDNYYYEGKRTAMFLEEKVTKYHRTLTTYLNTLLSNSFIINQIVEPQPPENMMDIPGMADEMRRPMMLIVSAKKKM